MKRQSWNIRRDSFARYRRGNIAASPRDTAINIAITSFHSRLLRASTNEEASTTPSSRTYSATCPLRSLAAPALRSPYARVRSYTIHVDRTIYTDRSLRGKTRNNHCAPSRRTSRYRPSSTSLSCHWWHSVVTRYMISLRTAKSNSFRFTDRVSKKMSRREDFYSTFIDRIYHVFCRIFKIIF